MPTGQTDRQTDGQTWTLESFLANVNSRSRSLYAIARPSVCLSVTFVHPTQPALIFRYFTEFGSLRGALRKCGSQSHNCKQFTITMYID